MSEVVVFLSDYGLADPFVGTVHAVIARASPAVRVIDLVHGIPRHDTRAGALALRAALPYLPDGVVLAVVDPEVGAERRAVALRCAGGRLLVGPDNGLLMPAAEALGGVVEAVDISRSPHRLEPVSATFHGRDVFAPVAAALAAGAPLGAAGDPLDLGELVRLDLPQARFEGGALVAHALMVDGFGNVLLDATHDDLLGVRISLGRRVTVGDRSATFVRTFADVGADELLLYEDAAGFLALAVNRGNAAEVLGVRVGDELRLVAA